MPLMRPSRTGSKAREAERRVVPFTRSSESGALCSAPPHALVLVGVDLISGTEACPGAGTLSLRRLGGSETLLSLLWGAGGGGGVAPRSQSSFLWVRRSRTTLQRLVESRSSPGTAPVFVSLFQPAS